MKMKKKIFAALSLALPLFLGGCPDEVPPGTMITYAKMKEKCPGKETLGKALRAAYRHFTSEGFINLSISCDENGDGINDQVQIFVCKDGWELLKDGYHCRFPYTAQLTRPRPVL